MLLDVNCKILIVDDSRTARDIVRKMLVQLGCKHIEEAVDGTAALSMLEKQAYGLIISDWNMEPMNGQTLLENVRSLRAFKDLPFIIMTALPTIEKIINAKNARVTAFINKPFSVQQLRAKIAQISAV